MPDEIHKRAKLAAVINGKTLSKWIVDIVTEKLESEQVNGNILEFKIINILKKHSKSTIEKTEGMSLRDIHRYAHRIINMEDIKQVIYDLIEKKQVAAISTKRTMKYVLIKGE